MNLFICYNNSETTKVHMYIDWKNNNKKMKTIFWNESKTKPKKNEKGLIWIENKSYICVRSKGNQISIFNLYFQLLFCMLMMSMKCSLFLIGIIDKKFPLDIVHELGNAKFWIFVHLFNGIWTIKALNFKKIIQILQT